jgi:ribosome-binding protein aMBF1 (putative translation factor)
MKTHDEVVRALMMRSGVKVEVERMEREEDELLDALLKARQEAGLTQAELVARMGTQAPAVARLEKSLAKDKHSPSLATLRRYVMACGKDLRLQVC